MRRLPQSLPLLGDALLPTTWLWMTDFTDENVLLQQWTWNLQIMLPAYPTNWYFIAQYQKISWYLNKPGRNINVYNASTCDCRVPDNCDTPLGAIVISRHQYVLSHISAIYSFSSPTHPEAIVPHLWSTKWFKCDQIKPRWSLCNLYSCSFNCQVWFSSRFFSGGRSDSSGGQVWFDWCLIRIRFSLCLIRIRF